MSRRRGDLSLMPRIYIRCWTWWYILAIPVLGRERETAEFLGLIGETV